jgi:hypothetical protein
MNNEKNNFVDYIESRPPMTPEQYRLVKHAWEAGFKTNENTKSTKAKDKD